jgi:hypothetical protein
MKYPALGKIDRKIFTRAAVRHSNIPSSERNPFAAI